MPHRASLQIVCSFWTKPRPTSAPTQGHTVGRKLGAVHEDSAYLFEVSDTPRVVHNASMYLCVRYYKIYLFSISDLDLEFCELDFSPSLSLYNCPLDLTWTATIHNSGMISYLTIPDSYNMTAFMEYCELLLVRSHHVSGIHQKCCSCSWTLTHLIRSKKMLLSHRHRYHRFLKFSLAVLR